MREKSFLVLLCCALVSVSGIEAGAKVRIAQEFFDEAKDYVLPTILEDLQTVNLQELHISTSWWFLYLDADLTQPELTDVSFSIPKSSFTLNKYPTAVNIDIADFNMHYRAKFNYNIWLIGRNYGSIEVKYTNATIQTAVALDEKNGKVEAWIDHIYPNLANISTEIHSEGWLLWLVNWIAHWFPFNYITDFLITVVVRIVRWNINGVVAGLIEGLPYNVTVPVLPVGIDYHLLDTHVYSQTADLTVFSAALNATAFSTSTPDVPAPFQPYLPSSWLKSGATVQMQIGESMFDSMLWVLKQADVLKFDFSQSTLPPDFIDPDLMRVATLQFVIPELARTYPLESPISLSCRPDNTPKFDINATGIFNDVDMSCDFQVEPEPGTVVTAFVLDFALEEQFDLSITSNTTGTFLFPDVNPDNVNFSQFNARDSIIGPLDFGRLETGLEYVLQVVARGMNDYVFAAGIELPIPHQIVISEASFETGDRFLELSATVAP